jgi:heptosyltransferase I
MLFVKHWNLFRKLVGSLIRPRLGLANNMTKAAKFFYLIFSWALEIAGDLVPRRSRAAESRLSEPKRILIVKIDQLGDVLFSTLLLAPLKERFPAVRIDYLIRPNARAVLDQNPHVHSIYHWTNPLLEFLPGRGSWRSLGQKLRENRIVAGKLLDNDYDYVINARAYAPCSNRPLRKMGRALIAFDISERSYLADHWASYSLDDDEVGNYSNLLAPFGIESSRVHCAREFYNHEPNSPMGQGERYVVLSPVSFECDRQWPDKNWAKVIRLVTERGLSVALTGLPSQLETLHNIVPAGSRTVRVFTDLALREFAALVRYGECFAGIDSFPAHLAIAVERRSAILVNPGVYYLKGFSSRRFACEARSMVPDAPYASIFDIRTVTPEEVASFLLGGKRTPIPSITQLNSDPHSKIDVG